MRRVFMRTLLLNIFTLCIDALFVLVRDPKQEKLMFLKEHLNRAECIAVGRKSMVGKIIETNIPSSKHMAKAFAQSRKTSKILKTLTRAKKKF